MKNNLHKDLWTLEKKHKNNNKDENHFNSYNITAKNQTCKLDKGAVSIHETIIDKHRVNT